MTAFRWNYYFDLLFEMSLKELRLRYRNTIFGFLWAIFYPAVLGAMIVVVFQFYNGSRPIDSSLVLYLGLSVWNFFSNSLSNSTLSIVANRGIIKKSRFPYSVIPLSVVVCNFLHLFIAITFCILLAQFYFHVSIKLGYVLIAGISLIAFTSFLALAVAALYVRARDMSFFINALLTVWFYATPIIYSSSFIPDKFYFIWVLNPITTIFLLFQLSIAQTTIYKEILYGNVLLMLLLASVSYLIYRRYSNNFDDYV